MLYTDKLFLNINYQTYIGLDENGNLIFNDLIAGSKILADITAPQSYKNICNTVTLVH